MSKYYTMEYCTSNENGQQEVSWEYHRTFFQWLFNLPGKSERYVGNETLMIWVDPETDQEVSLEKDIEIHNVIRQIRFNEVYK